VATGDRRRTDGAGLADDCRQPRAPVAGLRATPRRPSDQYAFEHTTLAQRDWLAALPATLEPTPGVFVCHGQPGDDREYLLETVDPAGSRPATGAEVLQRLDGTAGAEASLLLCGHSHLPRVVQVGGTLCVNPGSVGLPAYDDDHIAFHVHQTGSPHARYAVCERVDTGAGAGWTVAQIAVAYDWHAASAQAARNGAHDWARWLATGRA
jgi:diadenosine tetraphosphatase ApaH/serine/threonine PP2A family protein phosphatase